MVDYGAKRPLDPFLANALREEPFRPSLSFEPLPGRFVSDHVTNNPVTVTRVSSPTRGLQALLYKTPIHEDDDGDPESFGKPIDSTHVTRASGVVMKETSLKNATDQRDPARVFNDPPKVNTFSWTGVQSRKSTEHGGAIDSRLFLKDKDDRFPIFRPGSDKFYAPRTAMAGADGQAVNAQTVPYGALSEALQQKGRVEKGDFGLAIRLRTGASCGFLFADSGGKNSSSVGEYSVNLTRTLFGGHPTSEAVSFIVFPRTTLGDVAFPERIGPMLARALVNLAQFENVDDIVTRLARPQLGEPLFAGRTFVPQTGLRMPLLRAVADEDDLMEAKVRSALRRAGLP
jgi:hypothetical protein